MAGVQRVELVGGLEELKLVLEERETKEVKGRVDGW